MRELLSRHVPGWLSFARRHWHQIILTAFLCVDVVSFISRGTNPPLGNFVGVILGLSCIVALWHPVLGATLGVLMLPASSALELPTKEPEFALVGALTLMAVRRFRAVAIFALAVTLINLGDYLFVSPRMDRFTGMLAFLAVGIVLGFVLSWLRRLWHRRQAEIVAVQTENARLRELERRRLGEELSAIVTTHAQHLAVVGAREAHGVDELRAQLNELGDTSREALAELRLLVSALRTSECLVSDPSTHAAAPDVQPPAEPIGRRYLAT